MFENIRKSLANFILPVKNAMSLPKQFLKYGNRGMLSNWTDVIMSDQDLYSGYGYAAIRNRANKTARIAIDKVMTQSSKKDYEHPYINLIQNSNKFSQYAFWNHISTYLDLEGVYYLMAVRAIDKTKTTPRIGNIKEFVMLNPYNVRRIMDKDGLEVAGYIETRKGNVREIPKEMIIPIYELNPFDEDKPFAMTDAAKESQFTLKTAGDYTRHSLRNNINAPGILSTDIQLEEEDFENFIDRVKKHKRGEPIFGNGAGAIKWEDMQTNIKESGLKEINEINRESLFAVSGVSKTLMGIEQSGTTRETSNVQKDLNTEDQILPRIQLILDALNLDYKNNYPDKFKTDDAFLIVDNPMEKDHDAEKVDTEVKQTKFDLFTSLVNAGYDEQLASDYAEGKIGLDKLGKPKNEAKSQNINKTKVKKNDISLDDTSEKGLIKQQQASLKNSIVNVETELVGIAMSRIRNKQIKKNDISDYGALFDDEGNLIPKTEQKKSANELLGILTAFYGIVILLQGNKTMRDRVGKLTLPGNFSLNTDVKKYISTLSKKVSQSHVDTVSKEIYDTAKEAALKGLSQDEIINELKTKYGQITENRATLVARTETNRAFTRAQFEADIQFVDQNDLKGKVYKQWQTRSDDPCPICEALEKEGPVPFEDNFRNLGDVIVVGEGKDQVSLDVNFEALQAGNAHPNCSCTYNLIIKS